MVRARRFGRVKLVVAGGLALALAGCSSSGGKSRTMGDASIASVSVAATTGADLGPVDAAPSPDGSVVYYIANGTSGPVVFSVAAGGATPVRLAAGAPFVKPTGVAVATDGSRVYVADAQAGRIFSLPSAGGTASAVAGSEGRAPRGLDVSASAGRDVITFTGSDPADKAPAVFSIPAAGGAATVVAKGAPLVSPDAVVVAGPGVAYVSDRGASSDKAAVYKISGSSVTKVADARLGDPGGLSLTRDLKTLLVSSQNPATGGDQVLLVDLATGDTGIVSKVIGANHNSSGGLHRAYNAVVFAWCGTGPPGGAVYRVDPAVERQVE